MVDLSALLPDADALSENGNVIELPNVISGPLSELLAAQARRAVHRSWPGRPKCAVPSGQRRPHGRRPGATHGGCPRPALRPSSVASWWPRRAWPRQPASPCPRPTWSTRRSARSMATSGLRRPRWRRPSTTPGSRRPGTPVWSARARPSTPFGISHMPCRSHAIRASRSPAPGREAPLAACRLSRRRGPQRSRRVHRRDGQGVRFRSRRTGILAGYGDRSEGDRDGRRWLASERNPENRRRIEPGRQPRDGWRRRVEPGRQPRDGWRRRIEPGRQPRDGRGPLPRRPSRNHDGRCHGLCPADRHEPGLGVDRRRQPCRSRQVWGRRPRASPSSPLIVAESVQTGWPDRGGGQWNGKRDVIRGVGTPPSRVPVGGGGSPPYW